MTLLGNTCSLGSMDKNNFGTKKRHKKVLESIEFEMGNRERFEIESIERRFFERAKTERKEGARDVNYY